jgi:hypothetical protein
MTSVRSWVVEHVRGARHGEGTIWSASESDTESEKSKSESGSDLDFWRCGEDDKCCLVFYRVTFIDTILYQIFELVEKPRVK